MRNSRTSWPQWMCIRTFAAYTGLSFRTLESWKSLGALPPHVEVTARHHRWRQADIDSWMELRRRGLFDDWQSLRTQLGTEVAWSVMQGRLTAARGAEQQRAHEAAR